MSAPDRRWSQWAGPEYQTALRDAEEKLSRGEVEDARKVLEPIALIGEPTAVTLLSQISHESEAQDAWEARQRVAVEAAATKGFAPALYLLGLCYDEGELGYPVSKAKAAKLFAQAAEKGHVHSQWIHALDLLNGSNGVQRDESLGRIYLQHAAEANLKRALESLAEFHRTGAFGFSRDEQLAAQIAARAALAEDWI